jgi:hypothetical protein
VNRVTIDAAAWQQGFRDGEAGRRPHPTGDRLAYHSGFIEGGAQRLRLDSMKENDHE